jgi:hypothetical protein
MNIDKLRQILEWSTVLHYSIVVIWFIAYSRHRRWYQNTIERIFSIPAAQLEIVLFALMGIYKIGILLFFLVPSIALRLIG